MAYVRWLISEHQLQGWVIRRYEVETPRWYAEWDLDVRFPRLVELELRISQACADYFRHVPYSLAESIWYNGLRSDCFTPFCCCWDYGVLYYPREPAVRRITEMSHEHTDPVVLSVWLGPAPGEPWDLMR